LVVVVVLRLHLQEVHEDDDVDDAFATNPNDDATSANVLLYVHVH
jgi:hypothetical protein